MTHKICDACETVQHCSNHGCVPLQPAQHQPVAIVAVDGVGQIQVGWITPPQHNDKLYTQPPALQKPLSNFAKAGIYVKYFGNPVPAAWYAAVNDLEAAHGIGN